MDFRQELIDFVYNVALDHSKWDADMKEVERRVDRFIEEQNLREDRRRVPGGETLSWGTMPIFIKDN